MAEILESVGQLLVGKTVVCTCGTKFKLSATDVRPAKKSLPPFFSWLIGWLFDEANYCFECPGCSKTHYLYVNLPE